MRRAALTTSFTLTAALTAALTACAHSPSATGDEPSTADAAASEAAALTAACNQGDASACFTAGERALKAGAPEGDIGEALRLYDLGCQGGDPGACNALGMLHVRTAFEGADPQRGRAMVEAACEAELAVACSNLGFMAEHGIAGAVDLAAADRLYRQACELGEGAVCTHYAMLLLPGAEGSPFEGDEAEALSLLQEGCAGGDAAGCIARGRLPEGGLAEDPGALGRALPWFEHLCGGDIDKCPPLGDRFSPAKAVGRVVPTFPEAAKARNLRDADIRVLALVDQAGSVAGVEILEGDPVFLEPIQTALHQWTIEPAQLDGEPVLWLTTVHVTFKLSP